MLTVSNGEPGDGEHVDDDAGAAEPDAPGGNPTCRAAARSAPRARRAGTRRRSPPSRTRSGCRRRPSSGRAAGRGTRRRWSRRSRRSAPGAGRRAAGTATPAARRRARSSRSSARSAPGRPCRRRGTRPARRRRTACPTRSRTSVTTDVVTGSRSSPATTPAGSGCASVTATALRITSAPTLSSAIQIARGT